MHDMMTVSECLLGLGSGTREKGFPALGNGSVGLYEAYRWKVKRGNLLAMVVGHVTLLLLVEAVDVEIICCFSLSLSLSLSTSEESFVDTLS